MRQSTGREIASLPKHIFKLCKRGRESESIIKGRKYKWSYKETKNENGNTKMTLQGVLLNEK